MQQRAGWRHPQPLTQTFVGIAQQIQGLFQVATRGVATVDQAQRQHFVGRQAVENGRVLLRCLRQVDVQAIDRQVGGQAEVASKATEVGGDKLLQRCALKNVVDAFVGVFPVLRQVLGENRFIDLHPFNAQGSQAVEALVIQRQQAVEQLQLVEVVALGFTQPQVGQWADHHWFDCMAQGLGVLHFFEKLFPVQCELLVVGGQRVGQNLVVPSEVADWQQFDAGVFLHLPVAGTQLAADRVQAGFVEFTLPEGFLGLFQLAVAADTWKAQVVCQCHVLSLQHA
ncbi:hypothetical protein D9M71_506340 [compost metagenome]